MNELNFFRGFSSQLLLSLRRLGCLETGAIILQMTREISSPQDVSTLWLSFDYCSKLSLPNPINPNATARDAGGNMFFGIMESDGFDNGIDNYSALTMNFNLHVMCNVQLMNETFVRDPFVQMIFVTLRREFIPKLGIYWGFPWEQSVRPSTTIESFFPQVPNWIPRKQWNQSENTALRDFMMSITVQQTTVTTTRPIGIIPQCISVLSGLGGLMTIGGAVFYFWFIERRPETGTLTLRGWGKVHPLREQRSLEGNNMSALLAADCSAVSVCANQQGSRENLEESSCA